jgi:hypothetical protein
MRMADGAGVEKKRHAHGMPFLLLVHVVRRVHTLHSLRFGYENVMYITFFDGFAR